MMLLFNQEVFIASEAVAAVTKSSHMLDGFYDVRVYLNNGEYFTNQYPSTNSRDEAFYSLISAINVANGVKFGAPSKR